MDSQLLAGTNGNSQEKQNSTHLGGSEIEPSTVTNTCCKHGTWGSASRATAKSSTRKDNLKKGREQI